MKNKQALGFVWFITLVALVIRLYPALTTQMPLNDGGLFYVMINDLLNKKFSMPLFTTYNGGLIPFTYPPFAFYLGAIIVKITGAQTLDVLRLIPPVLSAFSVPAFYSLGRRLLKSDIVATLATIFFAFTPLAFEWQIMGGGLTRSLGQIFFILTLSALYDFYAEPTRKTLMMVSFWAALTVYSHPESIEQTVLTALWFWIYFAHSRKMLIRSVVGAILVILLTIPWWGTLISRFGIAPILSVISAAGQEGVPFVGRIFLLFTFNFADEPYLTLVTVLGVIGLFIVFSKKKPFLPVWMLLALLIDLRSGARFATMPLAMLAAVALSDAVIPAIRKIDKDQNNPLDLEQTLLGGTWLKIFTSYVFITLVVGAYFTSLSVAQNLTVRPSEGEAMQWLSESTGQDAIIVTINEGRKPLLDAVTEWMPALTGRRVTTSAFGQEWLDGEIFGNSLKAYRNMQTCGQKNESCLSAWMEQYGSFDFIFFSMKERDYPLRVYLLQSTEYQQVYENDGVSIFQYISSPKDGS
jgi:hypothetical protein